MKIALIIGATRARRWHARLAQELRRTNTLDVYVTVGEPWPSALRLFLASERTIFRFSGMADAIDPQTVCADRRDASFLSTDEYDCIVDLTSSATDRVSRNTLALRWDGEPGENSLLGRILRGQAPEMTVVRGAEAIPIASSYPAIEDGEVLSRALSRVFARAVALLVRAVEHLAGGETKRNAVDPPLLRPPVSYSTSTLCSFATRAFFKKIARQISKLFYRDLHWSIAVRRELSHFDPAFPEAGGFKLVPMPTDAFYADPFLFEKGGDVFLFAEKYPYSTNQGIIVCAAVIASGGIGAFETVLEAPYHISYPQVFAHDGTIFMMPETRANETVEIYRCVEFPGKWVIESVLMEDLALSDATLLQRDGLWWIFAAAETFGGSSHDELFAFHARDLRGPWLPHAKNPLISDCRFARPAGRFLVRGTQLFRPAQDCETSYGSGLVWREITILSPDEFEERSVARWGGQDLGNFDGVHTYTSAGEFEAVDVRWRAPI
jgi:hypothetical protein